MKTFFSNNRKTLMLGGVVNLLILCILVTAVIGPSQGTHAQTAWTQQDQFSVFCNFYYHDGKNPNADADTATCNQQSNTFLSLLKQETIPDNYAKWPQQVTLDDLAMAGLLINPATETTIRTQQDFQAAIPGTNQGLLALFQGDSQFLPTLWDYNPTYDHLPNCDSGSGSSVSTCPTPPTPSPNCPITPQNFQYSNVWPVIGPMLLTMVSQQLQDHHGRHIDTFGIYGRLLLQDNCSVATLAQTLLLNGQSVQASQAYQMEQNALVQIAIDNSSNTQLLIALIWAAGQTNSQQLDSWFSAAIITYPINPNAPPTTSTQPTTSTLTPQQPPSSVSVGSPPQPQQTVQIINIIQKNDKDAFDPPIVMITKGTKVVWKNTSDDSHTVTPDVANAFAASSSLAPGQTFQWIPTTAGTYTYHCSMHPYMKAIVVVT